MELIRNVKMKALKELARRIWHWLTAPSCQARTYTCCSDAEEDEQEQAKKPGGWIY
jgi:hypothetical protein